MKKEIGIYTLIMMIIAVLLYLVFNTAELLANTTIVVIYWTHISAGSLSLGITILYFIRYRQTGIRALLFFFLSKLTFLVFYIVQAVSISMLNAPGGNPNTARLLYYLGIFLGALGPSLFIIFISSYVYEEVRVKELILPLVYIGMLLSYILNDLLFGTDNRGGFVFFEYKPSVVYLNFVGLLMYVYVGWYTIYRIRQTRDRLRDPSLRRQQMLFMIGTSLVYILTPFIFAMVSLFKTPSLQFYWINVFAPTYIIAGISLTAIPYISSTKAAFLQPQPLHQLIVIKEGGTPVLTYNFDSPIAQDLEVDKLLFSSAVSAISSLMDEAINSRLTSLNFEGRIALTRFDEDLAFVVIIDFVTSVIMEGLDRFAKEFTDYFQHHPEFASQMIENAKNRPEVEKIILDNFGY